MGSDSLFGYIEQQHGSQPWGHVLDAGTGDHSLRWIQSLPSTAWTAVTVDRSRYDKMLPDFRAHMRVSDRILLGNWTDEQFLVNEQFDVVLADYLVGALDVFTPFFQHKIFARLRPHVKGVLYMVGWEPFPDRSNHPVHRWLIALSKAKDACRLLSGQRAYREYPASWVQHQLHLDGYVVEDVKHFTNIFRERYVDSQVDACFQALEGIADQNAASALRGYVEKIRDELMPHARSAEGIRLGADYIVTARPHHTKRP